LLSFKSLLMLKVSHFKDEVMSRAIAIMREKKLRYLVARDGITVMGILSVKDVLAYYDKGFDLIL
jgi:CBS domain-containing protein